MERSEYNIVSGLENIPLEELHIRWIPMARLGKWYSSKDGYNMMALVNSPHIEIMQIFNEHGFCLERLKKTRYWAERKYRQKLGMKEWTKEHIIDHLKTRYKTFLSLRENGFNQIECWDYIKKRDRSIMVWKEPLWNTRFNLRDAAIRGLEIQNGAGRCATWYVLGHKTIPGKYIEDAKPGTCKCENIEKRFK